MPTDGVKPVVLVPGEWVLTEWRGRFFAVGAVVIEGTDSIRQARCCNDGHDSPDGVEPCWKGGPSAT